MVSTNVLLPLLTDLMLPLLLGINVSPPGSSQKIEQSVDLIELNHFYDDSGRHAYDQIIFYNWSVDYKRYHVVAWKLVEDDLARMPQKDHARDRYVVRWTDRESQTKCEVWAQLFRESWSQRDPERANKKLLEEKYRVSLLRPAKQRTPVQSMASR